MQITYDSARYDVTALDCDGARWLVDVAFEPDADPVIVGVKINGKWMHVVEVLSQLQIDRLHAALDAELVAEALEAE